MRSLFLFSGRHDCAEATGRRPRDRQGDDPGTGHASGHASVYHDAILSSFGVSGNPGAVHLSLMTRVWRVIINLGRGIHMQADPSYRQTPVTDV